GSVAERRTRARGLAEGRVLGDVLDALAVDEDLPSVVEGAKIVGAGSHEVTLLPPRSAPPAFAVSQGSARYARRRVAARPRWRRSPPPPWGWWRPRPRPWRRAD